MGERQTRGSGNARNPRSYKSSLRRAIASDRKCGGVQVKMIINNSNACASMQSVQRVAHACFRLQHYRCICSCISRSMGIMLWFKCAMMIIEPNTSRPTTKMPKASARTLLVWSGALEMCRKNTK